MSKNNNYDHSKKKISEAVGISDERLQEIEEIMDKIPSGCETMSEMVEKLVDSLSANELGYLVIINSIDSFRKKQIDSTLSILRKITDSLKEKAEETQKRQFFMGGGGDA